MIRCHLYFDLPIKFKRAAGLFVCLSATVVLVFYVFERERENVRLALELSHFIVLSHRLGRHATLLPNKCVTAYKYPECQAFLGGNLLSPSPIGRGKVRRAWIVYVPHFHAVVVQKRQRNVQKIHDVRVKLLFC